MFNESQRRYLLSRLHSIEETLSEAMERLGPPEPGRVFRAASPDATPAQRKILADYLAQLRFALRRFMLTQQLRDERRLPGGLWSLQTAVVFAKIAAEELRPRYWRGYGEVDSDSAAAAERFAAEVTTLLHRIGEYLAGGEGGGLAARLEELAGASDEIRLLTELERIISSYGLTELRAPLGSLIDRAACPVFEIAVFGRVSSGKSSLLNWWLGRALLPTGITPVTAVPTRILRGERVRVQIESTDGKPFDVPVEDIGEYVSEQGNPANAKHVLSVLLEAPSAQLEGGIRLVDTPGLGSLATVGAAKTLEYLPRCDLGILLIEAGAPVAPDDLDIARALLYGGSDLMVVLSKTDRLSKADLEQSLAYVRGQFEAELAIPVALRPISTLAGSPLAKAWFDEMLAPRLAGHTERAAQALRRKIAILRESVVAILDARLRTAESEPPSASASPAGETTAKLHERIAQARSDFERARSEFLDLKLALIRLEPSLLEAAAEGLARGWLEHVAPEQSLLERVQAAISRRADEPGHAIHRMLDSLRDDLITLIEMGRSQLSQPGSSDARRAGEEIERELARPRGRPILDVNAALAVRPKLLAPWPMLPWSIIARPLARARLRGAISTALVNQLSVHAEALYRWSIGYLDELTRRFDAAVATPESAERFSAEPPLPTEAARTARRDLERLRHWPVDAA